MNSQDTSALRERARAKFYEIAGGSYRSGDVRAAKITSAQRLAYFRTPEFREWVAAEKAAGRHVFWLKDVDMTQAAGDIFTFFFKWRADNGKFSKEQLRVIERFLLSRHNLAMRLWIMLTRFFFMLVNVVGIKAAMPVFASLLPDDVIRLWLSHEDGGDGFGLLDFWRGAYWPSQFGLTRAEKEAQVREFVAHYVKRIFPNVREENLLLEELGVNVVIVSNGDQELAIAAATELGIKPENGVGSHLMYDEHGVSTGVNHSYEVFGDDWHKKPQPGKGLSFHYWLHMNRARFGWDRIVGDEVVIAGMDGDSAGSDGGMMILNIKEPTIGAFMVDTPDHPTRVQAFQKLADKYGWTPGLFCTLVHERPKAGFRPTEG